MYRFDVRDHDEGQNLHLPGLCSAICNGELALHFQLLLFTLLVLLASVLASVKPDG